MPKLPYYPAQREAPSLRDKWYRYTFYERYAILALELFFGAQAALPYSMVQGSQPERQIVLAHVLCSVSPCNPLFNATACIQSHA